MAFTLELPYPAGFHRVYDVRSENPLAELWRFWLRYTDFPYLSREWPAHTDDEMTAVATFVRQAYELHVAAAGTSLLTRPLLVYYSLHNLAKAFLLLKSGVKPAGYHGLAKVDVTESLLDISAETNGGLFLTLAAELGRQFPVARRLSLATFVANALELEEPFQNYFQKDVFYASADIEVFYGGKLTVKFATAVGQEEAFLNRLRATTQILDQFEAAIQPESVVLTPKVALPGKDEELGEAAYALVSPHLTFSVLETSDGKYRVKTAAAEEDVPSAAAYLAYTFLLSSVVRYFPDALDRFVINKKTSTEWFVAELCDKASRVFPNLLLNALNPYPFKFTG